MLVPTLPMLAKRIACPVEMPRQLHERTGILEGSHRDLGRAETGSAWPGRSRYSCDSKSRHQHRLRHAGELVLIWKTLDTV